MKLIKVAAACLNQTPFDWSRNLANIKTAIERARAEGVTVLCLPEPSERSERSTMTLGARGLRTSSEVFLRIRSVCP